MTIAVVSATGTGRTTLSAFDNALKRAGIYNYNLISLSSICPVGAKVVKKKHFIQNKNEFGFRLYVVKADIRSSQSDKVIAAGLGWYMLKKGGGVFVEHSIEGSTRDVVEEEITFKISASLQDLCEYRGEKFHKQKMHTSIALCQVGPQPCCALTLAIYKSEPW